LLIAARLFEETVLSNISPQYFSLSPSISRLSVA
jgi:hypothetical protein